MVIFIAIIFLRTTLEGRCRRNITLLERTALVLFVTRVTTTNDGLLAAWVEKRWAGGAKFLVLLFDGVGVGLLLLLFAKMLML